MGNKKKRWAKFKKQRGVFEKKKTENRWAKFEKGKMFYKGN